MKYICAVSIIALCALIVAPASAALIHPDVMGTTVTFKNIEESSPTGDTLPLYGAPSVSGNDLIFPTTGSFSASSTDGGPSDQSDGKLTLMIVAKPGNFIDSFRISENGLTNLNRPFGGDAFTQANTLYVANVVEINGVPVNPPAISEVLTPQPLNGQYQLSVIGGNAYATGWSLDKVVPLPPGTTKVNISLNNNLFAATMGGGTRAFIDKKAFDIDVRTHNIPEPAAFALVLLGVSIGAVVRRRVSL
jgi:PEP-CTERM motif-containing protein